MRAVIINILKKNCKFLLPSTYIIGKRKKHPEPKSIVGWPNFTEETYSQSEITVIENKDVSTYDLILDKEKLDTIVVDQTKSSNSDDKISEGKKLKEAKLNVKMFQIGRKLSYKPILT